MKKRLTVLAIFAIIILLISSAIPTGAAESNSVTLSYEPGKCNFDFYMIAHVDENEGITLADHFDDYAESSSILKNLSLYDAENLRILSSTLEALILRDNVEPSFSAQTDEYGHLRITNVEKAIYLVIGETTSRDSYVYSPSPIFISVPNRYSEDSDWQYHITVEHSKYEKEQLCNKLTEYKVMKLWLDEGNEKKRPKSIKVDLLMDGKVYDTVTLSADNNWTHTWKELPADHSWTAAEKNIPDGYSMTVEKDHKIFIIKNTYENTPPPPPKLPPTGQLKWPVPVMLLLGVISFTTGWLRRKYL